MGARESLEGVDLFQGLTESTIKALSERCQWRDYTENQQVVGHQDESCQVFFLVRGKARAIVYSLSGKEVTFRDIQAGEMFGEFAAIDGQPRSASVQAVQNCLIASMSPDAFWQVLKEYPDVMAATLRRLTAQVRALSERVFEFSTLAVKNRIHAELLRLANQNLSGDGTASLVPAPTHAEIASRISSHREAVTRELNRLAQEGIITRRSGNLVIRDVARLSRLVHEVVGD